MTLPRLIIPMIAALLGIADTVAAGFASREVTVTNPADGVTLAGTLTLPAGDTAPRAAIVLATGSGSQDRDEEILGHRPFKVIAEYLSERGYAVLRMDDRGVGGSTGDPVNTTLVELTGDITAALRYLDSCFTDTPRGVLGHSQGGSVAIRAAADRKCDFIVTLAAPAWRGDSIVMSQTRAMATALTGRWDNEPLQRRLLDLVISPLPAAAGRAAAYQLMLEASGVDSPTPAIAEQLYARVAPLFMPSYRDIVTYDPAADISAITCPWLALNGELDTQVLPANLSTITQLNPAADTRLLPAHNHLFQHATTGLPTEYQSIAEDISPETLAAIADWLNTTLR